MRNTSKKDGQPRVTRGFSIEGETTDNTTESPRRVRTRAQIISGEGKRPPAAVKLALLAHNPFNPREELANLTETANSLRAKGQIQPVTVARRAVFLQAHPGQEQQLGEAEYVVIDGNRRLAAALLAELDELRIDVNDDLAASAADILESALIANIHREDVAPLDQARAIQELVTVHGSQGQVARRLGKTPAWVSQRLALLELTPDLQEKVESGELKVEPARRIGRLPKEQQAAEASKTINAVKTPRQRQGRTAEPGSATEASTVNAVNSPAAVGKERPETSATVNAVNTPVTEGPLEAQVPGPEAVETGEGNQPKRLPYDDPAYVVQHLHVKMTAADFAHGARAWLKILREQHPEAYEALLREVSQEEQPA